jgi:hypothetical protein
MLQKFFLDHPATVGESYYEHFGVASGFGLSMISGGLRAVIHAFLPNYFQTAASDTVISLHQRLVASRNAQRDAKSIEWMI